MRPTGAADITWRSIRRSPVSPPALTSEWKASRGHFYLEAVRLGTPPGKRGEDYRFQDLQAQVDAIHSEHFRVVLTVHEIGPRAAPTRALRHDLRCWLEALDPEVVSAGLDPTTGFRSLPYHGFRHDGWELEFRALPRHAPATRYRPLIALHGRGEATVVRNIPILGRALDGKANRYGALDAPLVIAVLCNTSSTTQDYQIQEALYGLAGLPPARSAQHLEDLYEDGHWLTASGWRRGHAPQVITATELQPWWIAVCRPQLWTTLEPGVHQPDQPSWLSPVDVSTINPVVVQGESLEEHFDLPPDWMSAPPDFDEG